MTVYTEMPVYNENSTEWTQTRVVYIPTADENSKADSEVEARRAAWRNLMGVINEL